MQTNDTAFTLAIIGWLVIGIGIIIASWRRKNGGVGILINYLVLLTVNHWAMAALVALPYYDSYYPEAVTKQGFYQSLIGLVALGVGSLIIAPLIWKQHDKRLIHTSANAQVPSQQDNNLPIKYLVLGLITYFVILPVAGSIPTIGAFAGNMAHLVQTGIVLVYWQAKHNNNRRLVAAVLALALAWPIWTIVAQGFLGFGAWLLLSVFLFVVRTGKNPTRLLLPSIVVAYISLSLVVTYLHQRHEIREIIWYSSAPTLTQRMNIVTDIVTKFEFFNPARTEHLEIFDYRFAFNFYTGLAMERLDNGVVQYASGETITNAFLMMIPRVIWPDKPIRMGGDAVIFEFTGIDFYRGTTVQPPQVMEFYINFGTFGVIIGFIVMGTVLALVDEAVARSLVTENWRIAALLFVPAISLLQAENSLIALVGGSVSGLVTIILVNEFLRILRHSHITFQRREIPRRITSRVTYAPSVTNENIE
jgi:hypothetical protein